MELGKNWDWKGRQAKRRYFESLAVIISKMFIEDNGLPIMYLKFNFNTSYTNSPYFILEQKHFARSFAGLKTNFYSD